jgi:acetoin utilization deacetylase AcuC-like enzyme
MLSIFYVPAQNASQNVYSPSSSKPQYVVEDWLARFGDQIELHAFDPVSREALKRVHLPEMVDGILDGQLANGFGNKNPSVAASLPYTSGSLLSAAEHAVLHRTHTCSPTSGFHHAGFAAPGGFCTFNGLMLTAVTLRECGLVNRVGILDCDVHYGNGTDDIIQTLGLNYICHRTMGAGLDIGMGTGVFSPDEGGQARFLRWLDRSIEDLRDCDVILYQAGADAHVDDPLGGKLETRTMAERDRRVFSAFRRKPLVWNLAGGYQRLPGKTGADEIEPVLALHRQTMQICLNVNAITPAAFA